MSAAQQIAAAANPHALLRMATVQTLTGFSRSHIYQLVANSKFPAPLKLGARCTRFKAGEVTAWLQSLQSKEVAK